MTSKLAEGGATSGVGAIHISEIIPTLNALERVLKVKLKDNVLGSVGKKQFSGDIDVALQLDADQVPAFIGRLKKTPEILGVEKSSVIMTKVKIVEYDASKLTSEPRTGYVQVDFMLGDPKWLKTYYYSPSETESKYKGAFRNIMIAAIAAVRDRQDSADTIDDGRAVESERWMWSPVSGLVRIHRTPVARANGSGYTKKNNNKILHPPIKSSNSIANALGLSHGRDLNSFESLLAAIQKNYPAEQVEKIKQHFISNKQVQAMGIPTELTPTLSAVGTQSK